MGSKILFISVLSILFLDSTISLRFSFLLGLTIFALYLFAQGGSTKNREKKPIVRVYFFALASVSCYALADLVIAAAGSTSQMTWPFVYLLPLSFAVAAFCTAFVSGAALILKRKKGSVFSAVNQYLKTEKKNVYAVVFSGLLNALQTALLSFAIFSSGKPTEINMIYSTRIVWGLVLSILLGNHLGLAESKLSKKVIFMRSISAGILFVVSVSLIK